MLADSKRGKGPHPVPMHLLLLGWAALGSAPEGATGVVRLCGVGRRYTAVGLGRDASQTAGACGYLGMATPVRRGEG